MVSSEISDAAARRPCVAGPSASELLIVGGHVVGDGGDRSALAVRGDRIVAVGTEQEARAAVSRSATVVHAAGGTVLPGINDSHLHLLWFALTRPPGALDLSQATSLDEIRELVRDRARALEPGRWIRGHGWRAEQLSDLSPPRAAPARTDIDDVTPAHPVVLTHWSTHAVWANSRALAQSGVSGDTADPPGGRIERDESGEPTGVLLEAAMALVTAHVPEPTFEERSRALLVAMAELNALGVTSVTDPVVTPSLLRDYIRLRAEGRLTVRIAALLHWDWPSVSTDPDRLRHVLVETGVATGLGDEWLRISGAKLFADGVPSLRTAWMSRAYDDGTHGGLVGAGATDDERRDALTESVALLHRHRLRVQVHATGDLACDAVVAAFDRAQREDRWPSARHSVIHGNFLSPHSAATLAEMGGAVTVNSLIKWQGSRALHGVVDDDLWHANFPTRALIDAGVVVSDSSDAPIAYPDWRRAVQALVTRDVAGFDVSAGSDQRITRDEALAAWTANAAYMEGAEREKGTLAAGKLADVVVLREDLRSVPDHELHAVTPVLTVAGGRIVHDADSQTDEGGTT